ncbi:hypothetical protein DAI22_05g156700 [Oryza sativa Japonica Group]|nr:hypothetical protein DAI22_05g156700 [Oryza sativa Japonica Group]
MVKTPIRYKGGILEMMAPTRKEFNISTSGGLRPPCLFIVGALGSPRPLPITNPALLAQVYATKPTPTPRYPPLARGARTLAGDGSAGCSLCWARSAKVWRCGAWRFSGRPGVPGTRGRVWRSSRALMALSWGWFSRVQVQARRGRRVTRREGVRSDAPLRAKVATLATYQFNCRNKQLVFFFYRRSHKFFWRPTCLLLRFALSMFLRLRLTDNFCFLKFCEVDTSADLINNKTNAAVRRPRFIRVLLPGSFAKMVHRCLYTTTCSAVLNFVANS